MGRTPCCDKQLGLKKGPWTPEEDKILVDYIQANGHGSWRSLPKLAGLERCGKSCRLRWTNYLRPDIKRGPFTPAEQKSIIQLHGIVGNKWSTIAAQLPGRTDNEIKNYWNTHLKKRLLRMGINPETYAPPHSSPLSSSSFPAASASSCASAVAGGAATLASSTSCFSAARHMAQWESARLEAEARLSRESLLFSAAAAAAAAAAANSGGPTAGAAGATEAADQTEANPDQKTEPVDVFLRMWHSDIGEAFRSKQQAASEGHGATKTEDECSPAASSSCNTKQSSAVTVSEVNNDNVESGRSSAEAEEDGSDETYQFYLDLAAGDELSLFQNDQNHHHHLHQQLGMSCCYSWFGNDLNGEASDPLHDHNPFK